MNDDTSQGRSALHVPEIPALPEGITSSHPAYSAHLGAIRSIERVVSETTTSQDTRVAAHGILQILRLKPLVLTGAGVSTDSGIPDYRGPKGSLREHRPMTYQEFKFDAVARHRYWARAFVGWQHMGRAAPNTAHRLLARWNEAGLISGIVTQNVDGLHQRAAQELGSRAEVISLHGDMERVECLECGNTENRTSLDTRFREANPGFLSSVDADAEEINPDGDAEVDDALIRKFRMVGCLICGSQTLKPTVVYFGESVPRERKNRVTRLLDGSGGLFVVGSSLAVMSGYRFVLDAEKAQKPVGIVNGGPTRGDDKATYRWRARTSEALTWLAEALEC